MDALEVRPVERAVARACVERWHYSHVLPPGRLACYGAIEHEENFLGVVVFGRGASPGMYQFFNMKQDEMCELVRVALVDQKQRETPTTRVVAAAIRSLHRDSPGLRLVVSYADETTQGHLGVIYQASNWLYLGLAKATGGSKQIGNAILHNRAIGARYGNTTRAFLEARAGEPVVAANLRRHRYVYPLDRQMRRRYEAVALPYPRGSGLEGEPLAVQAGGAGSTPATRSTDSR